MFISAVIAETSVREYILYLFSDFTEYVFTLFLYLFFFKLTCQKVVRKNLALILVYSRNRHIDFKTRHFLHHSLTFIALTLLVGRQEQHPTCKNCSYMSRARCTLFAYGPELMPLSSLNSIISCII